MKPVCIARYAFGYKRTLDHLRAWQFVLPTSVKEAVVSLSLLGRTHTGTRLFIYEHVPQLKYHNPTVNFSVERHRQPISKVKFVMGDGSLQCIETSGLRQREIQGKIVEHFEKTSKT